MRIIKKKTNKLKYTFRKEKKNQQKILKHKFYKNLKNILIKQ